MKVVAVALASVLVGTTAARADDPDRDYYPHWMIPADLALLVSAVPAISAADEYAGEVALVYGLVYLSAGALVHDLHGNRREVGRSLGRRPCTPTRDRSPLGSRARSSFTRASRVPPVEATPGSPMVRS